MTSLRFSSQFETYRYFSLGEKAIPFDPFRSELANCSLPLRSEKTPL